MTTTITNSLPHTGDHTEAWFVRNLNRLATVTGVTWLAFGLESIIRPDPHNYRDAVFYIPFALTLATIVGLHGRQRDRAGGLERVGFWGVVVSMVFAAVGAIPVLLGMVGSHFLIVVPLWIVSMIVFGVATARAGVFPRAVGVLLALSELLAIATGVALSPWLGLHDRGAFSGATAHGVVFLVIAACLQRSTNERPWRG